MMGATSEVLLWTVASNSLIAGVIAVAAVLIQRTRKSPSLAHVLWVLALVKMVTPPLIPITVPTADATPPASSSAEALERLIESIPTDELAMASMPGAIDDELAVPEVETAVALPAGLDGADRPRRLPWADAALWAWGLGAVWVFLVGLRRSLAFQRSLRFARPAGAEVEADVRVLASRLGVRRPPAVDVLPSDVSPMLWAFFGRARILLPQQVDDALAADQRRTLLAHELAHFHRKDHWVRLLEMVVAAVFWWNPLVWWMRRHLHVVEEECCDAWVVWAMPGSTRRYADTLIDTVELLTEPKRGLPAPASGAVCAADLKKRLTMIMNGTTPRKHGLPARLLVLAIALLTLPSAFAQERERRQERDPRKETLDALETAIDVLRAKGDEHAVKVLGRLYRRIQNAGGDADRRRAHRDRDRDRRRRDVERDRDRVRELERRRYTELETRRRDLEREIAERARELERRERALEQREAERREARRRAAETDRRRSRRDRPDRAHRGDRTADLEKVARRIRDAVKAGELDPEQAQRMMLRIEEQMVRQAEAREKAAHQRRQFERERKSRTDFRELYDRKSRTDSREPHDRKSRTDFRELHDRKDPEDHHLHRRNDGKKKGRRSTTERRVSSGR